MKIINQLLIIAIILIAFQATSTDASIRPIITSNMPSEFRIGLFDVNLTWYVIDDNLQSYTIFINNSIWKMDNFTDSNLIQVIFSGSKGFYNLTLSVYDYSGFNVNSTQYVKVIPSITSATSSQGTYTSYTATGGTPGFEIFSTLVALGICSVLIQKLRKKIKQ